MRLRSYVGASSGSIALPTDELPMTATLEKRVEVVVTVGDRENTIAVTIDSPVDPSCLSLES
jgi:hypothetical protein